jgi:hypothetical protein
MVEGEPWNIEVCSQLANVLGLHSLVVGNGAVGSQQPYPLLSFGER